MRNELYHHGVKGQKWGVRRYQNYDGTRTALGKRHSYVGEGRIDTIGDVVRQASTMKLGELSDYVQTYALGKNRVDTYLKAGTKFSRIQSADLYEPDHALYATYKKHDNDQYIGLFGKNLQKRANAAARYAERTGAENADELRKQADNMKIYQLSMKATTKLRLPSDQTIANTVGDLAKDEEFKTNLAASITDSKSKMLRPSQQILFNRAEKIIKRDPETWSDDNKDAVAKAFNLSLTNHNEQEISAQSKFYGSLKKQGYSALIDVNDKEYSSYHAKRPVIVFDTDKLSLQSVTTVPSEKIDRLYSRYNIERIAKDAIANVIDVPKKFGQARLADAEDYVDGKTKQYLRS